MMLLVLIFVFVVCPLVVMALILRSPKGWEDSKGFHLGEPKR